ncbi:MAG: hypothetical protein RIR39_2780 [Pseudomonadota bacterium]
MNENIRVYFFKGKNIVLCTWAFLCITGITLLLSGCATTNNSDKPSRASFGLHKCGPSNNTQCVVPLFKEGADIDKRATKDFPQHYLELYNEQMRIDDCKKMGGEEKTCIGQLKRLADYFNPNGKIPTEGEIGVALEGGGTKAASFALGTLAGLHELGVLDIPNSAQQNDQALKATESVKVSAISSVSGGSYAASYLYNRWFDHMETPKNAGEPGDWFRSCIPEYYIKNGHFESLKNEASILSCLEQSTGPLDGDNEFGKDYEFIGHVWKNHDLLLYDVYSNLRTEGFDLLDYLVNGALLLGETAPTIPFQFLARTVFRWPLNSSPTKLDYKLGLEREYGYSPKDWANAGKGNIDLLHIIPTMQRRSTRTLENFSKNLNLVNTFAPLWIINSAAPTNIGIDSWVNPHPRDPLRQQFELTWNGYGSGAYGYARQSPEAPFDFLGRNPQGLPIVDAVVASASFFDDDQTKVSAQPWRFLAGFSLHTLNITWFTELRNFNQGFEGRFWAKVLPWPYYFGVMPPVNESPYIHLQDGGNTENSGILPLLRRGYKTIVFAHGTQDENAEWQSICHLKNQLELDGTYSLRIPEGSEMERLMKHYPTSPQGSNGRKFPNHFDELCSGELDESDLLVFGEPTVAQLYCKRLGYSAEDAFPCSEFREKFAKGENKRVGSDLFFHWRSDSTLRFQVYRTDQHNPQQEHLISTILAIVPGIAIEDVKKQLLPADTDKSLNTWRDWCALDPDIRKRRQIAYCYGPIVKNVNQDKRTEPFLSVKARSETISGLSCTALAEVLDDTCQSDVLWKPPYRPRFPQNNFISQTIHTTYTNYAAYFDLARHQVRYALCSQYSKASNHGSTLENCP